MRILPGVLKELLKHVPTVLFQVVEWNELASELPKLSRRILQKEGYQDLFEKQKSFITIADLKLHQESLARSPHEVSGDAAEKVLELYFTQIFSPHGLFLDLRAQHFTWDGHELHWHPTGLWTKFDESFRLGLIDVYDGFYLQDGKRYEEGLKKIGLMNEEWPSEDKIQLSELFKAQFGRAQEGDMVFNLEEFRDSIMKLSDFMLNKKVMISKDFLYLGIYLVTLYSHLEQGSPSIAVKKIYLKASKGSLPQ